MKTKIKLGVILILARREAIQNRFALPLAREMAAVRLARLDQCLEWLQEESFAFL
jgi:hypothetical protein